ncbi:MAG: hypothetical protein IPJ30_23960 [Acidobacteria bacterium]|nr:hypothetical protein [Acidobacteriota bacterium]
MERPFVRFRPGRRRPPARPGRARLDQRLTAYNKGKIRLRCEMVAHRAGAAGVPIVFINLVAAATTGSYSTGAASLIADGQGDSIISAGDGVRGVRPDRFELDIGKPDRAASPAARSIRSIRRLHPRNRDYARKNRFKKAVLGFQRGSTDSTLVAALACEALGPENLLCVMMHSPFSSEAR